MKTICTSLLLTVLTAWSVNSIAQIVGTNAFIQEIMSKWVSMIMVPISLMKQHRQATMMQAGFTGFGMVADQGKDGWDVGSPMFCGDYFEPGSPEGVLLSSGTEPVTTIPSM